MQFISGMQDWSNIQKLISIIHYISSIKKIEKKQLKMLNAIQKIKIYTVLYIFK